MSAFIIPLGVMVNYGDLQFAERIMVARRSEMSAEWKVRFAIASLLWPFYEVFNSLSLCFVYLVLFYKPF